MAVEFTELVRTFGEVRTQEDPCQGDLCRNSIVPSPGLQIPRWDCLKVWPVLGARELLELLLEGERAPSREQLWKVDGVLLVKGPSEKKGKP